MKKTTEVNLVNWTKEVLFDGTTMLQVSPKADIVKKIDCAYSFVTDTEKYKAHVAMYYYTLLFRENVESLKNLSEFKDKNTDITEKDDSDVVLEKSQWKLKKEAYKTLLKFQNEIAETIEYLATVLKLNTRFPAEKSTEKEQINFRASVLDFCQNYKTDLATQILVANFIGGKKSPYLPVVKDSGNAMVAVDAFYTAMEGNKSDNVCKKAYVEAKNKLELLCSNLKIEATDYTAETKLHANQTFTRIMAFKCISQLYSGITGNSRTGALSSKKDFHRVEHEMLTRCIQMKYTGKQPLFD